MTIVDKQPPWQVLLIGGNSGVGKTIIAKRVAQHFGLSWLQVDDFRLTLQRVTTPEQQPALHSFVVDEQIWHLSPEMLCKHLIEVGRVVSHALEIVIANHVATKAPIVLEGDGILPEVAAQHTFANLDAGNQVRSVFLFEADKDIIFKSMLERGRSFERLSAAEQQTQVQTSWLYGQWLREEAQRYGLSALEARPWTTLAERVITVIK